MITDAFFIDQVNKTTATIHRPLIRVLLERRASERAKRDRFPEDSPSPCAGPC